MVISIEIEEIDRGFVVTLFDSDRCADDDKKIWVPTLNEAIDEIIEWAKKHET